MKSQEELNIENMRKQTLSKILTNQALERLGRIKTANPALVVQIENYLLHVYQTGQLKDQIGDQQLKEILEVLSDKRKTTIKRK